MSNIFNIHSMTAPWQGLNYSVDWAGHGVVSKPDGVNSIWECAFAACKKGWRVGFSFSSQEAICIDTATVYADSAGGVEYLLHLIDRYGGIKSVAFEHRDEAETFVNELDKIITWKLLKREYSE